MSSKASENLLSIKEHKKNLATEPSIKKPFFETTHLQQGNILLVKPKWFKGSRDRGLRGNLVA